MKYRKNLYHGLLASILLASPFATTHAFQVVGEQPRQSTVSTSYLNGDLLGWHDNTMKTSVGDFTIGDSVTVVDQTDSHNRSYQSSEKKPKVQLTFGQQRLIKVVIYH